jgi:glutamine synthetase
VGEDYARSVPPLPATLGQAVATFRDDPFPIETFGKDVVAHYAEAGRWEWERFLAPDAVTEWERRRYFDVI